MWGPQENLLQKPVLHTVLQSVLRDPVLSLSLAILAHSTQRATARSDSHFLFPALSSAHTPALHVIGAVGVTRIPEEQGYCLHHASYATSVNMVSSTGNILRNYNIAHLFQNFP